MTDAQVAGFRESLIVKGFDFQPCTDDESRAWIP